MTPRQARIALGMFILLAAGVTYNALYMQVDTAANKRIAAASGSPEMSRTSAPRTPRPRAGQPTKRTALLKPDSANTTDTPDTLPDEAGVDTVRAIQRELSQRGFGPIAGDGIVRADTRAAILAYEHDNRLPLTGEATEALLARLVLGASATNAPAGAGEVRSPQAEALIKQVQRMLVAGGYRSGAVDGRLGAETAAAIRAFEQDQGLVPRGRVSAEVVTRLQGGPTRLKAAEAR